MGGSSESVPGGVIEVASSSPTSPRDASFRRPRTFDLKTAEP